MRYAGPDFFADVPTVAERLPMADPAHPGMLVLDVGVLDSFSSTMLKELGKYHAKLAAHGSALVLVGISAVARETLDPTEFLERLGPANVLSRDSHVGADLEHGHRRGQELLAELRASEVHRSASTAAAPGPGGRSPSAPQGDPPDG